MVSSSSEERPLVCPYCRTMFRDTADGREGFEEHECLAVAPSRQGTLSD